MAKGSTFEDYIPPDLLFTALRKCDPSARLAWKGDQYIHPMNPPAYAGRPAKPDKIAIAREITLLWNHNTT